MAYKDGETFTTYCDKPYDRHTYRMIWKDGSHTDFDSWEIVRYMWHEYTDMAERVHIVDRTAGKGF